MKIFLHHPIFVTILMMLSATSRVEANIGIVSPPPPQNSFSKPPNSQGLSLTNYASPILFSPQIDYFRYEYKVDSTKSIIVGESKIYDPYFAQPVVYTLSEYRVMRTEEDVVNYWRDSRVRQLFQTKSGTGGGALEIDIPWRVRSKTFQKIFGGDRVGLRVTGNITINGGLRRQKSDQVYTTQNDQANYSFRIDQTQRFNIEGKVGDKVSVFIDQDSERMFEFENSLKLEYTGQEDEIVQKIEAGNVSLALTGTQLATFSGTNKGLFGLKTESKMGPLKLTTIASVEKGQKNKKSLKGGAEEQTLKIESTTGMVRNRYFFLNTTYRNNFPHYDQNMVHYYSVVDTIGQILLYKKSNLSGNTANQGLQIAWAMNSPDRNNIPTLEDRNNIHGYFTLLDPNEYAFDRNLGLIRLNIALNSEDVLACAYTTAFDTIGDITTISNDSTKILKLIRPDNPQPSDSTWELELKSVYSLQSAGINPDGFQIDVYRKATAAGSDTKTQSVNGQTLTYLTIFGLDTRGQTPGSPPDGVLDNFPSIINWANGEIILPGLRPFDPDPDKGGGYEINDSLVVPALDSATLMPTLYDTVTSYPTVSRYYFSVKYQNASASYSLGFNVLEGSEEVYLNGRRLQKGVGYNIDYMTGNLTILDESASSPTANLEVFWESGEIFQLDKKTLLGVRSEYELWNPESFIGTTALYLNEKPLEQRVKVGNEPIRNFILDANTRMVLKPDFLTKALDFLPLLEADAASEVSFEAEVARLYPNPNPLNNDATGDYNGVAYLDDFESSKRVTSLGIMRRNWTISSVPPGAVPSFLPNSILERNYMRGHLIWYNPYDQVAIQEIWPDREVNSQTQSKVHVLDMEFDPKQDTILYTPMEESWAGVQRYLSAGYADQSKSKFLEVWLNQQQATGATLNFDLGQVSEDAIPNDSLNTEDKPLSGMLFGNGILDPDEDVGLDMMANNSVASENAGGDFWDLNKDGIKQELEPYSDDNYDYDFSNKNDYEQINGTENNELDEGERRPDTEDLNSNGSLDKEENFFRLSVQLPIDSTSELWGGAGGEGWVLVRFPLKEAEMNGNPAWTQIEYARIWLTDCDEPAKVRIATIELVGNEWEEVVETDASGVQHTPLAISVVNTYDNPNYTPPPGVSGIRDPITNILSKEQSLVVKVEDLPPKSLGMVQKTFLGYIDMLKYNALKMFVHGGGGNEGDFANYDIDMFFRFGSDTSHNYYEIYQKVKPGWDAENEIFIDLNEIPRIKLDRDALIADPTFVTETMLGYKVTNADTVIFGYRKVDGDSIVVMGEPSLSQIRQLTIGIYNAGKQHIYSDNNVELWFDELRLSEVKKNPGTAYRTSADIRLSDLGNIHLELNKRDADYHSLNERMDNPGSSQGSAGQSVSGTFALDRFLPPTWGIRIPFNGNFTRSTTIPKYYPGSDIPLNLDDQTAVDTVKNFSEQKGWGISYSKGANSSSKILQYTVDKLSSNYNYSQTYGTSPINAYSQTQSRSASLRYNLTLPSDKTIGILGWAKGIPLLKKLKDTRFNYFPTKIDMQISGTRSNSATLTRTLSEQKSETFGLTRTFASGLRPFTPMNFDVTRTYRSNMLGYEWADILQGDFGIVDNINQNFTASYAPVIFRWLTHDVNYTTNYQWSWGSGYAESGKTVSSNTTISTSWNLKTTQLFRKPTPRGGGRGTTRSPAPGGKAPPEKETESKKEGASEKPPNPLTLLKSIASKLNDIRFDYNFKRDLNTPGVTGEADWKYQLGLSTNPGIGQISSPTLSLRGSASYSNDYQVKSGLDLLQNLKTNFDYSYRATENFGNTVSGQYARSQFYIFSSKDGKVKHFPFVNLNARLTGLEKAPFFAKIAQTVSVESGFTGKSTTDWNTDKSNITKHSYERNFSPLLGVNITWNGGVSSNFQLKKTQSLTDMLQADQKSRSSNTTISLTANYNRKSGFRIPIPVWPFKNKEFKNNTTFSLTFSASARKEEMLSGNATKFNTTSTNSQWSLMPKIDYTFSNSVTGGIHYETGVTKNSATGKTSFHEFGFNVNIQIRGR